MSYMLAGEGEAIGVSNSDPFATDPATKDDWVKEGPHLMILVPDPATLEGLPRIRRSCLRDVEGHSVRHIMVKVSKEK